jgi:CheY-like chemotaxis protein
MVTSSLISSVENRLNSCDTSYTHELKQKIQACTQTQFTGRLDLSVKGEQGLQWNLFFHLGCLVGGASHIHSIRRWCRQLSQHCPQLISAMPLKGLEPLQYWGQDALVELVQHGRITPEQLMSVIEGNLVEILFDVTQLTQQRCSETRITYRPLSQKLLAARSVAIQPDRVWQQVEQAWQLWQQAGLANWSPNWAPVIWDAEELRRQTSLLAYHNLTKLVDGDRTLRDIAIQLKQPLVPLTQSILPYLQKGIMGLINVGDLVYDTAVGVPQRDSDAAVARSVQVRASSPLVAYIEDSRLDSIAMSQFLASAGCRFVNVRDPVQALPTLLEHKPSLIFLDLLMPVTNGYEVCAQIRRISAFKDTPVIIVTSSDGIVDRVRAKLAGSSGFIAKPIEPEKVLNVLRSYLPKNR